MTSIFENYQHFCSGSQQPESLIDFC